MKNFFYTYIIAWFLSVCGVVSLMGFVLVTPPSVEAAQGTRQNSSTTSEVLTLKEVAHLLRVDPKVIANLARHQRIPGRLIGEHWRFRRTAILDWLGRVNRSRHSSRKAKNIQDSSKEARKKTEGTFRKPSEPSTSKSVLSEPALMETTGRGPGEELVTLGEKKEGPTAEDISLRGQQVLLKPQQLTLELDFSFTRSEQAGLTVVPIGPTNFLANSLGEQDLFIWSFTARYGLPHDLLLVASLPLIHDRRSVITTIPGTMLRSESTSSLTETGDFFLGLRHTTVKEGIGYPEVILSLQTLFPTRKSSFGFGGGIALIKRIDPVALFANLDYVHVFSREFEDVTRLRSDNVFNMNFGYAFSMNERLALSTSVQGTFTTQTSFANSNLPSLPSVERFFLRASLTALLRQDLFVEPFITFALNGSDIVTLGLNIPYTFDVAPYMDKLFN